MWEECFQHLGDKNIAAGDYNSKHTLWGQELLHLEVEPKYIRNNNSIDYPQVDRHTGRLT